MNKTLSISLVLSSLVLAGCSLPRSKPASLDTDNSLESSSSPMIMPNVESCKKAVQDYLAWAKTSSIDTDNKVIVGSSIVVDYIGRLADGTVFDTSIESVAKACNVYTAGRNYTSGLPFVVWTGKMIAGFDQWVVNMSLHETKTLTIPSDQAYGSATIAIPISDLPTKSDGSSYKAGESIVTMNGAVIIESITDKEFTIKNNHPLAGKDLIFDITIQEIK